MEVLCEDDEAVLKNGSRVARKGCGSIIQVNADFSYNFNLSQSFKLLDRGRLLPRVTEELSRAPDSDTCRGFLPPRKNPIEDTIIQHCRAKSDAQIDGRAS
ncbi:unnamed protein product [Xylocopa violacea]|uniref:Uncharacterized protein n=1 Tax=Xylocopa violacea TaxID=135666 RepID=A0ABP1NPZ6_XYLVO